MSIASTMNSFIQSMSGTNPPPVINAGGSATLVTDLTGTSRNIIGSSNQQQGRKWLIAETFVQQTVSLVQTKRHIRSSQSQSAQEPVPWTSAYVEMDPIQTLVCWGKNFIIISYTQRSDEVFCIFLPSTVELIVPGATAYTCLPSGQHQDKLSYWSSTKHSIMARDWTIRCLTRIRLESSR